MEIYIRQQSRYKLFIPPLIIYTFTEEVNDLVGRLGVWITRPLSTKTPAPTILGHDKRDCSKNAEFSPPGPVNHGLRIRWKNINNVFGFSGLQDPLFKIKIQFLIIKSGRPAGKFNHFNMIIAFKVGNSWWFLETSVLSRNHSTSHLNTDVSKFRIGISSGSFDNG